MSLQAPRTLRELCARDGLFWRGSALLGSASSRENTATAEASLAQQAAHLIRNGLETRSAEPG